jgi:aspartate kinase
MRMVLKFGGTSLMDSERVLRAAERAAEPARQGAQVVVVVSAQGHTTDTLAEQASIWPGNARERDALLAAGEQMSAGLMAMALASLGCRAVSLTGVQAGIFTNGDHGNAQILALGNNRIVQELEKGKIAVVTGFQGVDAEGDITTLGRGGSDTTAVALAALLGADVCRIYTDVDGVYNKDPRYHADAVRYDRIGYDAMLKLAQDGAQVLHDRCVEWGKRYHVPIHVLSSFRPGPGTLVTDG